MGEDGRGLPRNRPPWSDVVRIDDCKRILKLPRVVHMSFTQDTEESEVT